MPEAAEEPADTAWIPLFPLHTVLLPGTHLSLFLFEPRYRQLAVDLMNGTIPDRSFGVVAIKATLVQEVNSVRHVHPVGCTAHLRQSQRLPDGQFEITAFGERRFRLLDIDTRSAQYLMGLVEWVPDEPLPSASSANKTTTTKLAILARLAHQRYCESAWESKDWQTPSFETCASKLAYQLAADCLLPLLDRQRLLEEHRPLHRLKIVSQLLTREAGFLTALGAVPPEAAVGIKPPSLN